MTNRLTGRCHCGAVSISIPSSSAGVLACHCGDCRKMHGNFNAFLVAPRDSIEVTGGAALVWHQSSKESRRAFCATCGARVVKEQTSAGRWLVSAGLIEGQTGMRLIRNLWEKSKPDWYDLPEVTP